MPLAIAVSPAIFELDVPTWDALKDEGAR